MRWRSTELKLHGLCTPIAGATFARPGMVILIFSIRNRGKFTGGNTLGFPVMRYRSIYIRARRRNE